MKTWIYLPKTYLLTLLSPCNWTWRKDTNVVYAVCFPYRLIKEEECSNVFKSNEQLPVFFLEEASKRGLQLFCTVPDYSVSLS